MDVSQGKAPKLDLDVLIIDDAATIRNTMRTHLEASGIPAERIHEANNAKTGLDAFEQHPPDLVLLELVLPDIPGDELGAVLLERDPGTTLVPLTALDSRDRRVRRLVSKGAADVLQKPIQPDALDNLLDVLRNRGIGEREDDKRVDPKPMPRKG